MEIEFNNNVAEFELNFNFYDYPSIIEAAKEFIETSWISIKGADDGNSFFIRIEPKNPKENVRDAAFSFLNYVLGIMHGKIKNIKPE